MQATMIDARQLHVEAYAFFPVSLEHVFQVREILRLKTEHPIDVLISL